LIILAEQLLKKEVIFQDDLETIFGKRPHEKTLTEEEINGANKDKDLKSEENDEKASNKNPKEEKPKTDNKEES